MGDGKMSQYFKYAFGELLLVILGILIALQINNWNEGRKEKAFEVTVLQEIDNALTRDSVLINDFFEPRMYVKEAALDTFIRYVGENKPVERNRFVELYNDLETDFAYRFNTGPYETIKSAGMDRITNDALRSHLTRIYDETLPAFKYFINVISEKYQPLLETLEQDVLGVKVTENHKGDWELSFFPQVMDVYRHPSFLRILAYEEEKAENARSRMDFIKNIRKELHDMVRKELNKKL